MDKAISTILITIASVVSMLVVINAVLPAVSRSSGSIVSAGSALDDRIKSNVEVVHATGEVGNTTAYIWAKNVGATTVGAVDRVDLFFGTESGVTRVLYGGAGCTAPCWEYTVENAAAWEVTATLKITIHLDTVMLASTTYYVKVVLPNGVFDARYFTL